MLFVRPPCAIFALPNAPIHLNGEEAWILTDSATIAQFILLPFKLY